MGLAWYSYGILSEHRVQYRFESKLHNHVRLIYQISVRVKVPEYVSYFCIVSTDKKRSYVKEQYVCPSKQANFTVRSQAYLIFSVLAAPLPLASYKEVQKKKAEDSLCRLLLELVPIICPMRSGVEKSDPNYICYEGSRIKGPVQERSSMFNFSIQAKLHNECILK